MNKPEEMVEMLRHLDSAAGVAISARDPYNQAVFTIRKPANVIDEDSNDVAKIKGTFNDVCDICGIEPGDKCDPSKSTMNRILALTDGDVDGDGIAISIICLLAKHCRPLVEAGMVGRILPPAYKIPNGKNKPTYVHTQREFFNVIMKKFVKNVSVSYKGKELTKSELFDLLSKNFVYDTKLEQLAARYCCDPRIMEYIAWKYHGDYLDQKKSYWMDAMKRYKDLRILMEHGMIIIDGDVPGYDYMNLAFDEYFDKFIHRFKEYQAVNSTIDGYAINGESGKTLYDVMSAMRKYIPDGVKRYKGLGELDPKDLRDLCMDKDQRTVIIMKFEDFEDDMEKINVIMSSKKQYSDARARLMTSIRAQDLDLDT